MKENESKGKSNIAENGKLFNKNKFYFVIFIVFFNFKNVS